MTSSSRGSCVVLLKSIWGVWTLFSFPAPGCRTAGRGGRLDPGQVCLLDERVESAGWAEDSGAGGGLEVKVAGAA